MISLENKKGVITGGSSGIGLAVAQAFEQAGGTAVITGRDKKKLQNAEKTLKKGFGIQADVTQLTDLNHLFREVGPFDILVANAGGYLPTPLGQTSEKVFDELITSHVKGTFFTIQAALPYLANGGSIVMTSSIAGHRGYATGSVYAAVKAAIRSFGASFAIELASRGIRVNSISPGYVETPPILAWKEADPTKFAKEEKLIPAKRFGQPEEIAALVLFLVSNHALFINGTDIVIDGGHISGFSTQGNNLNTI